MVSIYRPLLEECIGGTNLLSDLSDVIGKDGRLKVKKAEKEGGTKRSMQVLLDLIDASPHQQKWKRFYKALKNNDFEHVITALKDDNIPENVRQPYCEVLLQLENVDNLKVLISSDVQNKLIEKEILSNEDVEDITTEKEMCDSESAAVLVTLDRLWRKKKEWLEELSDIFKLSQMDDLAEKLLQYSKEQTIPKDIQVTKENPKQQQTINPPKDKAVTEETERESNTEESEPETDTEETKPKTIRAALHEGSNSRPGSGTDSSLPTLPDKVGTTLLLSKDDEGSSGTSLPVHVGTGFSSISNSSTLPANLVEPSTSLPNLPQQVGVSFFSEGEVDQMVSNTERIHGEDIENLSSNINIQYKDTGSLNSDVIAEIGEALDASVERSLHRDDSLLYQDEESLVSSEFDEKDSKAEKEAVEATEKETFPTLEMRKYQLELAELAVEGKNTIICAETGTGKTYVALYVTEQHLASKKNARVVFLARTNALLEQQFEKFTKFLYKYKVYLLKTDKTAAMGRKLAMAKETHHVFFMTPQILLNNINSGQISLPEISLLILDECHHTRKREPYNNVLKQYLTLKRQDKGQGQDQGPPLPQILGLTATIGVGKSSTLEGAVSHILSVCASLDVLDISKVQKNKEELEHHVAVPKRETRKLMEKEKDVPKQIILDKMESIENYVGKTEVVNQPKLKKQWDRKSKKKRDGKQYQKWTIHFRNRVMCKLKSDPQLLRKLHVALTHLSTYNEALAVNYLMNSSHVADFIQQKLADDIKQHQVMLKENPTSIDDTEDMLMRIREQVCQELQENKGVLNDHLKTLRDYLVELKSDHGEGVKGMIFVETRATAFALAKYITEELEMLGYKAAPFTGSRSSDSSEGMQEDEKIETLKKYREGEVNLLVATSVGSEGIDVPDCNFIITYNYTGNEADIMQMSGRARKQNSTVTHISDQAIQRREETSLQKALLMARAFDRLNHMTPKDLHRKIKEQQDTIQDTKIGSFFLENNVVKSHSDFAIICWKCQVFAGHSSDIRIYTGQHRLILDQDFSKRCTYEDVEETSRFKKRIIRCKKCKTKWGTTFALDSLEIPVLKVKAFLFVPGYTGVDLEQWKERKRFKAWGKVEFYIGTIEKSPLLEALNKEENGGNHTAELERAP